MTINADRKIISLTGPNCSFANINACRVDVVGGPDAAYTPTVIVTNQTELNAELAKTAAQLEGQVIGIQYNATPYVIDRTGTGALNGKDFGASGVVLTQYGATRPVFSKINIDDCTNVTLHSLEIHQDTNGVTNDGFINLFDNAWGITIDSCIIHGKYYDPNGNYTSAGSYAQKWLGITGTGGVGKYRKDLTIKDCTIYNVRRGFALAVAGTLTVEGNTFYNLYEDPMSFSYDASDGAPTTKINWNVLYNPIGASGDADDPHFDFVQFLDPGAVTWTVEVLGNVGFIGNARGDFQGIFCNFTTAGAYLGGKIAGNVILNNLTHGITIDRASSLTVIGNTCVSGNVDGGGFDSAITIGGDQTTGTHVVKNNVSHSVTAAGSPTITNNHTATRSTAAYAALFNGTAFDKATLSSRSAALSALAMKAGSALDQTVNIGAVGSGYVDFDARTINGAME